MSLRVDEVRELAAEARKIYVGIVGDELNHCRTACDIVETKLWQTDWNYTIASGEVHSDFVGECEHWIVYVHPTPDPQWMLDDAIIIDISADQFPDAEDWYVGSIADYPLEFWRDSTDEETEMYREQIREVESKANSTRWQEAGF